MSHLTVFPAHTLFQILDRSVVLRPGELLIGPSNRFLRVLCSPSTAPVNTPRISTFYLPHTLARLAGETWLTGPDLPTYLGISFPATDVAVCGNYVYISFNVGA